MKDRAVSTSVLLGMAIFVVLFALKVAGLTTIGWATVLLAPLIPLGVLFGSLMAVMLMAAAAFCIAVVADVWTRKDRQGVK